VTQFHPCFLGVTRDFAMRLRSWTCRAASAMLYHHVSRNVSFVPIPEVAGIEDFSPEVSATSHSVNLARRIV
jgi:hypothetical protein